MIIKFKHGFEIDNFTFGWNKKDLYRLPAFVNKRSYGLKKLNKVMIGGNEGYRVYTQRKTIKQLKEITEVINYNYTISVSDDCPW